MQQLLPITRNLALSIQDTSMLFQQAAAIGQPRHWLSISTAVIRLGLPESEVKPRAEPRKLTSCCSPKRRELYDAF
jgi:hypothetical protein